MFNYSSYRKYMQAIDIRLEFAVGYGHAHLEDYLWLDAYEDGVEPNEAVTLFLQEYYPAAEQLR